MLRSETCTSFFSTYDLLQNFHHNADLFQCMLKSYPHYFNIVVFLLTSVFSRAASASPTRFILWLGKTYNFFFILSNAS